MLAAGKVDGYATDYDTDLTLVLRNETTTEGAARETTMGVKKVVGGMLGAGGAIHAKHGYPYIIRAADAATAAGWVETLQLRVRALRLVGSGMPSAPPHAHSVTSEQCCAVEAVAAAQVGIRRYSPLGAQRCG